MNILAHLRDRIIGNPRTTIAGIVILAALILLQLSAPTLVALTERVRALGDLVTAATGTWGTAGGLIAALALALRRDAPKDGGDACRPS